MLTLLASLLMVRPLVMAHYMPWYESKPVSGKWGWHWTMNHFDPEKRDADGRQQLASKYRPIIGAYDSSDPDTLECQTLQMKLAGIDGVFIDWYGTKDLYDYPILHRNTQRMIDACTKAGLKFSIVLEDQVVPNLMKAGKSSSDEFAKSALAFMSGNWFKQPGYLRWNGKPVLLIFGPQFYKEPDLNRLFSRDVALFTELGPQGPAVGAFGWPEPQVGSAKSWDQLGNYYHRATKWSASIPVAYPRFEDIYKAAGIGPGYGSIGDGNGTTFKKSLDLAMSAEAPFVQIATWNDWGEGTQIEPSVEFGYRDLEGLLVARHKSDPQFSFKAADLTLPAKLYALRKQGKSLSRLNQAALDLFAGRVAEARTILNNSEKSR